MTGGVDWSVLIFVLSVFVSGVTLAWFFRSIIQAQDERIDKKIDSAILALDEKSEQRGEGLEKKLDETARQLERKIEGLDVVAKADRVSITAKLDAFDQRDKAEHREMLDQITNIRLDIAASGIGRNGKPRNGKR